ncbi:hypothetical protein Lal_00041263 [Lupinus albus]|uniref:Putative reverse transcriptase zinc-binding domain-containing protein n=1 Tax=Lupinus albus TaxID=3870 RepID=A0A6A5NZT1_LUPAL|nr:putative reverse transcriptase zinc-binding domain-containing protein [Lupinus albus]KAF1890502.1 hypothetical protein Lal_00041263 [Lupinus albus]
MDLPLVSGMTFGLGSDLFYNSYKRLFNPSILKDGLISDFGKWVGGNWGWAITWRRELFSWEIDLSNSFLKVLLDCTLQYNKPDSWEWKYDKSKLYTVRSAYNLITHNDLQQANNNMLSSLFWKSKAPLKVLTFVWRLFQDKIPTKDALLKQGITLHDGEGSLCVFCNEYPESATHLFSTCSISYSVWQHIYRWLNICVALPLSFYTHYSFFLGLVKTRKGWKLWSIIWHATIWTLWLARNDIVFNKAKSSIQQLLNSVMVKSWLWTKAQQGQEHILFEDWASNPLVCLNNFVL